MLDNKSSNHTTSRSSSRQERDLHILTKLELHAFFFLKHLEVRHSREPTNREHFANGVVRRLCVFGSNDLGLSSRAGCGRVCEQLYLAGLLQCDVKVQSGFNSRCCDEETVILEDHSLQWWTNQWTRVMRYVGRHLPSCFRESLQWPCPRRLPTPPHRSRDGPHDPVKFHVHQHLHLV